LIIVVVVLFVLFAVLGMESQGHVHTASTLPLSYVPSPNLCMFYQHEQILPVFELYINRSMTFIHVDETSFYNYVNPATSNFAQFYLDFIFQECTLPCKLIFF
jgi:hypothetical protein